MHVLGRLRVEGPQGTLGTGDLPGRQGRVALAYLALERERPVPRDELADAVWGADPPPSQDNALSSVVSKLRAALTSVGLDGAEALVSEAGCYRLVLPPGTWFDVETAMNRVDAAEGALRDGDATRAWSEATVASTILRRPLLAGEDAPWIARTRGLLEHGLVRALDVLASAWARSGDASLAVRAAEEAVSLAPYRESGYRALMRVHLLAGDRAEAVRAFARLKELLADELGVDPAPETVALYREALRAE